MTEPLGEERKAALRAICEGWPPPTLDRVAIGAGLSPGFVRGLSAGEGWIRPDFRYTRVNDAWEHGAKAAVLLSDPAVEIDAAVLPAEPVVPSEDDLGMPADEVPDPAAVRERLLQLLSKQLTQSISLAERGIVDRSRLDAMLAMVKVAERTEALTAEQKKEDEKKSDEELAELFAEIDDRIVELAREYAKRLVAGEIPGEAA